MTVVTELTIEDLAALTGKAWRTVVARLKAAGVQPARRTAKSAFYRSAVALEAIYSPGGGQHALTAARTDLAAEQAERIRDERRERRGDLVSVATTGKVWGELLRELSMNLCSLPDRMVPELGLSADQHQRLEAECVGLLERLRAWKPGS
jgi:phage terminase Nu1 subunit (DNA packaging protein)